jgi:hypothetical protein
MSQAELVAEAAKIEKIQKNLIDYSKWKDIQDEEEDEEVKEERNVDEEEHWQNFLESANTWTKDEKDEYVGKMGTPALFAEPEEFKVRKTTTLRAHS